MRLLDRFGDWAWERHQNVLSWYIRPAFMPVLAYFAYRRSLRGILLTLVALLTSMFWFPKPKNVDPRVEDFLKFEREWLGGDWNAVKVLWTSLVPLGLTSFCLAFWKRSLGWGLIVINAIAAAKSLWSVVYGNRGGRAVLPPALIGLLAGNAAILYFARRKGIQLKL